MKSKAFPCHRGAVDDSWEEDVPLEPQLIKNAVLSDRHAETGGLNKEAHSRDEIYGNTGVMCGKRQWWSRPRRSPGACLYSGAGG